MVSLSDFDFLCSGRHGERHPLRVVLILRDALKETRARGKGKVMPKASPPEGVEVVEGIGSYAPKYVALTPYEGCYWINDEPIRIYGRPSTPHAQLVCPECHLIVRLSAAQAFAILEAYQSKGAFDIHKTLR